MPAAAFPESSTEFSQQLQAAQRLAGCYLLNRPIGGAPGRIIWLAHDEVLGKDVALHFLPQELVGQGDIAERLRQEVKRNRPLIHPHILRNYDFIEEEGWAAVSTDPFDGPTLAGKLQDGALEVNDIQPWIEQICQTLDDAHRIRIAHGGLTPHDIAVDGGRVRLMNFGIAAAIRDSLRGAKEGVSPLALSYASPAQLAGEKPGIADDIYALGAIVHELLAGEPPFRGAEREGTAPTIAEHRKILGHRGDVVPESWERAVAAALGGDAGSRPPSAMKWWELASSPVAVEPTVPGEPVPPLDAATPSANIPPVAGLATAAVAEAAQVHPTGTSEATATGEIRASQDGQSEREAPAPMSGREVPERAALSADLEPVRPASRIANENPPAAIKEDGKKQVQEPRKKHVEPEAQREPVSKLESFAKKRSLERPGSAEKKVAAVPAFPADVLADQVRREEAEEEARERGYYDADDEGYRPRTGGARGTRLALPIMGAAVGLLILFGVIKLMVGTPDTSSSSRSDAAGTTGSTTAAVSNTVPETTPQPSPPSATQDPGKIGTLPETSSPKVNPAPEPPPPNANTTPETPSSEPQPAVSAAQEHEAAVALVHQLETKLADTKKEIEEKAKALPSILKSADELAAQQKRRDDAANKAEQAALQAERAATEKRRLADESKKAAADLAEQTKTRREEHGKTQELLATLRSNVSEDEKALTDAKDAAANAAKRAEAESKKSESTEPARLTDSAPTAGTPPKMEKDDSDAAKARNEERKRIDEEMAALRRKLAEQAEKLGATLDSTRSPGTAAALANSAPPAASVPSLPDKAETPPISPAVPDLALNKPDAARLPDSNSIPNPADSTIKSAKAGGNADFMNSLGMKFAAVPGAEPMFCIWPTRVRDFETFARSTSLKSTLWKDPGFKQGPEHPVVNVTWQEAIAFCKWLTVKEQKEQLITSDQAYRLPTDLEWSLAVGLTNEAGRTPEERDMSVPDVYPWGNTWPPPLGAGNYTGEETGSDVAIKGYDDGFPWTSPVGSFPANKFGLFDLGGNVWEWCMDSWNSESKARVLRGASWYNGALKLSLLSSCRVHASPDSGTDNYGFRVVLAGDAGKTRR